MERKKIKNELLKALSKTIKSKRQKLNLTQEELAEKSGFHVNYIGGIERAQRNPSIDSLVRIARALGISPKDLMPE